MRANPATPSTASKQETQLLLSHNKKQQENMSDDLVKMVNQLKTNSLSFGDRLARDNKVIQPVTSQLINR